MYNSKRSGILIKINSYLISSKICDDFILDIEQDINRHNNICDEELIKEYMVNNYGSYNCSYINLDDINYVKHIKI
jgi:hypothetical protein